MITNFKLFESNLDDYHDVQDIVFDISDSDNYKADVMRMYNGMNIIIERDDYGLMGLNYFSDIIKRLMESKPDYKFTIKLERDGQWTNLKIEGDDVREEREEPVMTTDDYTGNTYVSAYTHIMGKGRLFNLMDKDYTYRRYQVSCWYAARKIMIILTK